MSKSGNAPRKPATKFPHLRKQMQKNSLPNRHVAAKGSSSAGRKRGK